MFGRSDTLDRAKHKPLTVELCAVIREYRGGGQTVRAPDKINLGLEGGQFVSIVGPSGAGQDGTPPAGTRARHVTHQRP